MEKINITVHDDYRGMSAFVRSLHESFDGEGSLVHSGRNEVRIISCGDRRLAVKRFAHNGMLRRVMNAFRRSKAQKAYANACLLRALCLPTPAPVAFVEVTGAFGLVADSYYICEYTDMEAVGSGLREGGEFNRPLTSALASFVAGLHIKGVFHHDLNSTNILYRETDGSYAFTLIDINRMAVEFEPEFVSIDDCLRNITRFSCRSQMFCFFVKEYLRVRGLPESLFGRAMKIKNGHDRRYAGKKKVTGMLKRLIGKNTVISLL